MAMVKGAQRKQKVCDHCSGKFLPVGNSQRYCNNCLGPAVETKWGLRYPGYSRLKNYGVSYPEWLVLKGKYEGLCWICKSNEATDVDHCHRTNQVRGALCSDCNTSLHYVEREGWLEEANRYLKAVVF